jgi:hypothetical protein
LKSILAKNNSKDKEYSIYFKPVLYLLGMVSKLKLVDNNEGVYLNPENTVPNQGLTTLGYCAA